ncbi:MAG: sigma-70 family RNA polymerase sigma factor [bacterium]|nr:sigma-70 family RNA polymerase sigma factor [bacterium]
MNPSTDPPGASRFHTTRWSVVFAAGSSPADSREALEELFGTYWRPVFSFIRRRGNAADEARDLTQGFFTSFLERKGVEGLDPSRGRFRAYLLAAVKNFLSVEKERARAIKRGGGAQLFSLSVADHAELAIEPADTRTPESDYERHWALALLRQALERLRSEQAAKGRSELFERLKPTLADEAIDGGYAAVAAELELTTVAVKVAAHRLKKRYGELIVEEVARTLELPQEIDDELNLLFEALGG